MISITLRPLPQPMVRQNMEVLDKMTPALSPIHKRKQEYFGTWHLSVPTLFLKIIVPDLL